MNTHVRLDQTSGLPLEPYHEGAPGPTTQAAEGLPRRAFTIDDLERMQDAGIIGAKERIELIGGELVPMSAKGYRHEIMKSRLNRHFSKIVPNDLELVTETSYRLTPTFMLEPDVVVFPFGGLKGLDGGRALLVVEIADSSLTFDLKRKAPFYAGFGVREYWVINAVKLTTTIHRDPSDEGYATITEHAEHETLTPHLAPMLAVSLAALDVREDE